MGGEVGIKRFMIRVGAWLRRRFARLGEERQRRGARSGRREARRLLPRSWLEVELAARLAVRSSLRLEDFLRFRLARYAARLPVPLESLPFDVGIENGEPVVRMRSTRRPPAPPPAPREPTRALREASEAVARLSERAAAARARVDAVTREIADDLAAGRLPGRPDAVDATPEQRGRPPVPHPAPLVLFRVVVLALLGATAYRLGAPALVATGLPAGDLASAVTAAPVATALALLFGGAAAAAVYAFLDHAVSRAEALLAAATPEKRGRLLAAASGGGFVLAAAVALSAALPGAASTPLLLVAVPLGAVLVSRRAGELETARAATTAAALEWDRARARDATERARRGEGLAAVEASQAQADAELLEASLRLRALEQGAVEADRAASEEAALAERRMDRLAEALASALELDRYIFLRRASLAAAAHGAVPRPLRPQRMEGAGERLGVA